MKRGDFSTNSRVLFIAALALVIGAVASGIAWFLIKLISFFTNLFFFGRFSVEAVSPAANHLGLWVIFIPALGGLIIGLMARFGSEKIRGHGIPEALEAILFGKSIMQPKVAILKPISSAISIGSGGPFGAEGPIIMTGGAFGSIIAQMFHLTATERKILLVAGAAAGMSSIFASPIAAVFLAVELLLFEWKPRSLIPVAIASITANALRPFIFGKGPLFPMAMHVDITLLGLFSCVIVGVIAGFFSVATSGFLYKVEDWFHKVPTHWMWWCVMGGLVVGLGGYFQPRALGVGYDVIEDLLKGNMVAQAALSLLVVKSVIWVISLGSGTSGGVLAPLLIMGCGLGSVEALFLPYELSNFYPLISMAAVMGGMMRAPFTAVMFALELTHNLDAVVPSLAATIAAYTITVLFMKRSILTEKVARRGYDIFREYSVDPLETVRVDEIMSREVRTIQKGTGIQEIREKYFLGEEKFRGYPVVDGDGVLSGMITAADVLKGDLNPKVVQTLYPHQSCLEAAEKMAVFGVGRLPVVSVSKPEVILGIVTRSDLLKPRIRHHDLEQKRERVFKLG